MTKWENYPNLRLRPTAPGAGRGRLQRQIRVAFIGSEVLTTGKIYDWCYARRRIYREGLPQRHRHSVYRLLMVMCERLDRAPTRGRPWRWKLKPEYARTWLDDMIEPVQKADYENTADK